MLKRLDWVEVAAMEHIYTFKQEAEGSQTGSLSAMSVS